MSSILVKQCFFNFKLILYFFGPPENGSDSFTNDIVKLIFLFADSNDFFFVFFVLTS